MLSVARETQRWGGAKHNFLIDAVEEAEVRCVCHMSGVPFQQIRLHVITSVENPTTPLNLEVATKSIGAATNLLNDALNAALPTLVRM